MKVGAFFVGRAELLLCHQIEKGGAAAPPYHESLQLQKVFQNRASAFRKNAFRMELHAPDRQRLVFHAHDFALLGLGSDF